MKTRALKEDVFFFAIAALLVPTLYFKIRINIQGIGKSGFFPVYETIPHEHTVAGTSITPLVRIYSPDNALEQSYLQIQSILPSVCVRVYAHCRFRCLGR